MAQCKKCGVKVNFLSSRGDYGNSDIYCPECYKKLKDNSGVEYNARF